MLKLALDTRVDLDSDVLRALDLQKTERLAVISQQDVRGILDDHDLVSVSEIDDLPIEVARGHRARWELLG